MQTVSNEHLNYYADRFVLLRLARAGITLVQYLANPEECERKGRYTDMRMSAHGITFRQYLTDPEKWELKALEAEPPSPTQHRAVLKLWAQQDTGLVDRPAEPAQPESTEPDAWRGLLAGLRAEVEFAERAVAHLPQRNGQIVEPLHHHRHPRRAGGGFIKRGES